MAVVNCWLLISWLQETETFSPDSCYYLRVARNISEGKLYVDYRASIEKYLTVPLYPLAIKLASFFIADLKAAAVWVNKVATSLLIVVVFFWGRRAFGDWPGIIAAWVTSFSMSVVSADILTESLFSFILVVAGWAIWETSRNPRLFRCVAAGVCMGLATLTREIAFALIPLGAGWIFLTFLQGGERGGPVKGMVRGGVYGISAVATIAPYWIYSLIVRGTWWGSRFTEREVRATAQSVSRMETTLLSVPRAVSAMWSYFPPFISAAVIIGLLVPLATVVFKREETPGRRDLPLVFILVFFLADVLAIGALGVYAPYHWRRYLLPITPLLVMVAAQGADGAAVLVGELIRRKHARLGVALRHVLTGAAMAGMLFSSSRAVVALGYRDHNTSYRNALMDKGMKEVARDFLAEYEVLPGTYVFDRKPFFAYEIGATWAGLPEDVTLDKLAEVGRERPILLVINTAVLYNYPYKQLMRLLAPSELPDRWSLLSTHFFRQYGRGGRLVSVYTYGDYYPAFSVRPGDYTYEEHLERAVRWAGKGRYHRAMQHCEAALALDNGRPECYVLKARIVGTEGIFAFDPDVLADAMDLAGRALVLRPYDTKAANLLCELSKAKAELDGSEPVCPR